jgi:thermitase
MKKRLGIIFLACITGLSVHAAVPGKVFVKIKKNHELINSNLIEKSKNLFENVYLLEVSDVQKALAELKQDQSVVFAHENQRSEKSQLAQPAPDVFTSAFSPLDSPFNDPGINRQWSFLDSEKFGVSVNKAYNERRTQPRKTVIVAVVDTGVDYNHEDLKEVMWINEGEIAGNGIDDDGNGYIDDVHGIDTLERDSDGNATGDPMDTHDHGSHVSGIIGAKQNNGKGIAGIASNVKIMAIRTVPNASDETDVDIVESFLYAAKHGAKLINCSFGKRRNEGGMVVSEAIKHIGEKYGVLVVAAAGNETENIDKKKMYPASFENQHLLVVASTNSSGRMSYFSNFGGKNVDVAAPGSSIYSTTRRNKYKSFSGTSMAAPTTVGVAAEILSHNPELSPLQLKDVVMRSVVKKSIFEGRMVTGGQIDLLRGLTLVNRLRQRR